MTNEDREFLASLINQKRETKYNIGDMAFKALSTVSMLLIVWIFSTVNGLKEDVNAISKDNEYTRKDIEDIKSFTAKPRFTESDFDMSIQPLVKQLNQNTVELNSRNSFMSDVQNRLIKLELKFEEIQSKK